jgi:hypothetical protein
MPGNQKEMCRAKLDMLVWIKRRGMNWK